MPFTHTLHNHHPFYFPLQFILTKTRQAREIPLMRCRGMDAITLCTSVTSGFSRAPKENIRGCISQLHKMPDLTKKKALFPVNTMVCIAPPPSARKGSVAGIYFKETVVYITAAKITGRFQKESQLAQLVLQYQTPSGGSGK